MGVIATSPWMRNRSIPSPRPYRGTSYSETRIDAPSRPVGFRFAERERRDDMLELQRLYEDGPR